MNTWNQINASPSAKKCSQFRNSGDAAAAKSEHRLYEGPAPHWSKGRPPDRGHAIVIP
jgi:hypothetical protein